MLLPLLVTLSVCLCQLSHCRTRREAPEGSYISEKQRLHLRSSRSPRKTRLARGERARGSRAGLQPTGGEAREPGRGELHALDGQCRLILISWGTKGEKLYFATIECCLGESLNPGSLNRPSLIKLFFLCKFALFQSREPFSITKSYKVGLGTWESFPLFRT